MDPTTPPTPPLLTLPPELLDHILTFLFAPLTHASPHPFPQCLSPVPHRFQPYTTLRLTNCTLSASTTAYFTKHIAPHLTFHFTSVTSLRAFQIHALHHPILKTSAFHIHSPNTPSPAEAEQLHALIRIQPAFKWWMDELPGFHRTRPAATQTSYGYFPATGPHAWKPKDWGVAVFAQTGLEICASPNCVQRVRRARGRAEVEVTEVRFPGLKQGRVGEEGGDGIGGVGGEVVAGGESGLTLSCFLWEEQTAPQRGPRVHGRQGRREVSVMVLEGKVRDVWVPERVVEVELKKRRERMA